MVPVVVSGSRNCSAQELVSDARVMRGQPAGEIGKILVRISKRIRLGAILNRVFGQRAFEMFERHGAFKAQLTGSALEGRDRDGIIERIVKPAQVSRLRD